MGVGALALAAAAGSQTLEAGPAGGAGGAIRSAATGFPAHWWRPMLAGLLLELAASKVALLLPLNGLELALGNPAALQFLCLLPPLGLLGVLARPVGGTGVS